MVPDYSNNHMTPPSARLDKRSADEIQRDFVSFKSFDIVDDYSDHHFAKHAPSSRVVRAFFFILLSFPLLSDLCSDRGCVCCGVLTLLFFIYLINIIWYRHKRTGRRESKKSGRYWKKTCQVSCTDWAIYFMFLTVNLAHLIFC